MRPEELLVLYQELGLESKRLREAVAEARKMRFRRRSGVSQLLDGIEEAAVEDTARARRGVSWARRLMRNKA